MYTDGKPKLKTMKFIVTDDMSERIEEAVQEFIKEHYNGDQSKRGRALELIVADYKSGH